MIDVGWHQCFETSKNPLRNYRFPKGGESDYGQGRGVLMIIEAFSGVSFGLAEWELARRIVPKKRKLPRI
jgi:hypothetical protein